VHRSSVGFPRALPTPDTHVSAHPAFSCRLVTTIFASCITFGSDSLLPSLWFLCCPECLDPFPLCLAFPGSLVGRHAHESYGSAAPDQALVTTPPTLGREAAQVPALLAQHFLRQP
jgi:hypothetical protein